MEKREANLDYLKVLSIMMIIVFHYFWNAKYDWAEFNGIQRVLIDMFYMLGELGVNCFALISGYFMSTSKKPFRIGKLMNLWIQIFIYSVLSAVVVYTQVKPFQTSINSVLNILMPITYNVWWYATAYFLLYLISPYINKMIEQLSKKEYRNLIIILLIVFCAVPTIVGSVYKNTEALLYYNRFIWLIVIYIIAGYIRHYDISIKKCESFKWLPWLIAHIATWITLVAYMAVLEKWPNILGEKMLMDAIYFWRPNTIIMLILSVTLFMFFKECKLKGGKFLTFLSSSTLGLYLIHGGRSGQFWWNRIFHNPEFEGTYYVFIDAFCALGIIMLCGLVIEFIRQKITNFIIGKFKK